MIESFRNDFLPPKIRFNQHIYNSWINSPNIKQNVIKTILLMKVSIQKSKNHIKIKGIRASTQDKEQSIFRTLEREGMYLFWSSIGTKSELDNEFLIYKVCDEMAMIHSVTMSVFKSDKTYPPKKIQFEVGDREDHYYYQSDIMDVDQNSSKEQVFNLLPDVAVGKFIRLNLIGKPGYFKKEYYHVIRYVGVSAIESSKLPKDQREFLFELYNSQISDQNRSQA